MTGRTGQKMGGCWQGKRPARIASQRLPYLGRLRKVRGDGGALPVPSAKNRHEVQQSCPCPGHSGSLRQRPESASSATRAALSFSETGPDCECEAFSLSVSGVFTEVIRFLPGRVGVSRLRMTLATTGSKRAGKPRSQQVRLNLRKRDGGPFPEPRTFILPGLKCD
jgi:hypothetical protein